MTGDVATLPARTQHVPDSPPDDRSSPVAVIREALSKREILFKKLLGCKHTSGRASALQLTWQKLANPTPLP